MTRAYFSIMALAFAALSGPAIAQEAPAGAAATGCDVEAYEPVVSERTGEVLYWTNSTCPAGGGATDGAKGELGNGEKPPRIEEQCPDCSSGNDTTDP